MNIQNDDKITMAHGSGGADSAALMRDIFEKRFGNEILARLEDSAVALLRPDTGACQGMAACPASKIAVSTDSFVVTPLIFPGGDIGKLAVCGTVNDILMSGALPRFLTCGFILETGLSISLLDELCVSLAAAASDAGVRIIAGDTKVIEGRGEDGGLMINTTGIGVFADQDGFVPGPEALPSPSGIRPGDSIIVSGNLGDHHAAILSVRMGIQNAIKSDCALLTPIIRALRASGVAIRAMRDVTRGGLGTVLNELASASGVSIVLEEEKIPVASAVRAFCGLMGLDPLYMGNEGKLVFAVAPEDEARALALVREAEIGRDAAVIGTAKAAEENRKAFAPSPAVYMRTRLGGSIRVNALYGEGLPRIC